MPDELVRLQDLLDRPFGRSFLTQLPDDQTALEGGQLLLDYCNRLDGVCVFAHIWPDFGFRPNLGRSYNDNVALWRELSRRVQEVLPGDSFCAQLNGGIFLAVHECEDEERLADDISLALHDLYDEPLSVNGRMVTVRCKSSRVFYPSDTGKVQSFSQLGRVLMGMASGDPDDMTNRESAQRLARRFQYTEERDRCLVESMSCMIEDGELTAAYRARATLETGHVQAAEMVLRWQHPVLGTVSQDEIWKNSLERGWSSDLVMYAAASALSDLAFWQENSKKAARMMIGLRIPAAALCWQGEELADQLPDLLQAVECRAEQFEIYLSEKDLLANEQALWPALEHLRSQGFKLVLDEFGSGGASLDLLLRLQPDALRLQAAWHRDASYRDDYLKTCYHSAEVLMVPAWVEGILDERQYIAARSAGYESGYGPYLGPARNAEAFLDTLKNPGGS